MRGPKPGVVMILVSMGLMCMVMATSCRCSQIPKQDDCLWLWVQDYSGDSQLYTRDGIDELIDTTAGEFTDLMLAARSDNDARMWFRSSLIEMHDQRIDGLTPGEYLIQRAHERGMRVHAWIYTGWWYTYVRMHDPPDSAWNTRNIDDSRCDKIAWVNFAEPGAREMIASVVGDLVEQNEGLDGIHLDYIRVHHTLSECPVITPDHISQTLLDVREAIGDCELTASISGNKRRNRAVKRDIPRWLSEGLVDHALMMSYVSVSVPEKVAYIDTLPSDATWRIVPGLSDEYGVESFREQLVQWQDAGYDDRFAVFDSYRLDDGILEVLETYLE